MGRAVRILGTVLALGFLGALIWRQLPHLPPLALGSPTLWAGLALAWVMYVLSQLAASEAWRNILTLFGVALPAGLARGQPMVSQIGKYIPGNVAHLIGRVAIGRRDGVAVPVLGAAMLIEVGVTLAVGLGVAGLLMLIWPDFIGTLTADLPDLATRSVPVAIATLLILAIGVGTVLIRARLRALDSPRPALRRLTQPLGLHLASFAILGVSLWGAAWAVDAASAPGLITCTMIFAFAWAAGFVMPGAPGGIGVRDSIIVLGLALSMGEGTGLAVALLHRAVSVLGDVTTFGLGWWMRKTATTPDANNGPKPAVLAPN
ncbi:MAG: hypothetical protein AB8B60_04275 [Sulfitobacter sp.]